MKMANTYLHVVTNQLRPLVEHLYGKNAWDEKSWENMGTTATAINLDDIDGANVIKVDTNGDMIPETHYILPIIDSVKANTFKVDCAKLNLAVEIMSDVEAVTKWNELKSIAKTQQETA